MDVIWSPWRYDYITKSQGPIANDCVFCDILQNSASDEENFILHRAEFNFAILNVYPYTSGHMMVLPYDHIASPVEASKASTDEMMDLTKLFTEKIGSIYKSDGINIGMNLGRAAGAGVASHYHMHLLPRWVGDANFMTAIGETRTLPEDLRTTFDKLRIVR